MQAFAAVAVLLQASAVHAGIISIFQNNVLGSAQFHRQQSWPFDPDVSARRTHEFVALHGDKSEKLIERIGLGLDGRQYERREQQAVRDILYDQQQRNDEQVSGVAAGGGYHHRRLEQLSQPVQAYPASYARRRWHGGASRFRRWCLSITRRRRSFSGVALSRSCWPSTTTCSAAAVAVCTGFQPIYITKLFDVMH